MKTLTLRMVVAVATFLAAGHAAAHGGLADLAVYDRAEGRWLPVYWHEGRAYVVGNAGNEYQIGYVIAPRGALEINGWRRSLSQTAAFYFTALPDSYAARTGRPDDVGVIGIALFRKKQASQPIAPAEPAARPSTQERDARLGTGHGRHEISYATHVTFERATTSPLEIITLYYDSHANLVARGVIREPVHVAPAPRPFPGFVPDPRG